MRIIITGTPGTGKSEVARALARKLDFPLFDIKRIVDERKIYEIRKREKVVDIPRLKRTLSSLLRARKYYVVEGHLACEMKLPADFVFVLRTHPKRLKERLSRRKYSRKKLHDNLLAEMLDYCSQRAEDNYGKYYELDTSERGVEESSDDLHKFMRKKKKKLDCVDYSGELKNFLRLKR